MRFEAVIAYSFGMLTGKKMTLAPGMTIIFGPNESGKSTWHAALYAGLCGMRRGKGQPTREEREFTEQNRPWNGGAWEVSVHIQLDDGRRVELRRDLEDRADCLVTDLVLGRDIGSEIINDGSPDGARWLGLDRRSFQAIACVRQADILSVLGAAEDLEQYLARAAATARTDATAAEAIERLERFLDIHVGSDRAPTKPFRQADKRAREAEGLVQEAKDRHEAFLKLMATAQDLDTKAEELRGHLRLHEAAAALRDAKALEHQASRARGIGVKFRDGPPKPLVEDSDLAQQVAAAIAGWENRPRVQELQGASAEELRQQIAELPAIHHGDLEPHPDVTQAQSTYQEAMRNLRFHDAGRPSEPTVPAAGGAAEQELYELALALEMPVPRIDSELQARYDRARFQVERLGTRAHVAALIAIGILGAVAGAGLVLWGRIPVGLLILVATGVLVVWMAVSSSANRARTLEELRDAENAIGEVRHAAAEAARRKKAAQVRANALGVPTDPVVLRALAADVAIAIQQRRELERWVDRRGELGEMARAAEEKVASILQHRGIDISSGIDEALNKYLAECAARALLARQAAKRGELERRLEDRLAAEEALRRALEADNTLRETAKIIGVTGEDQEERLLGLKAWQQQRATELEQHQLALQEWGELQTLLADRTMDELEEEARRKRETVTRLAEGLDSLQIPVLADLPDLDGQVGRLQRDLEQASRDAHNTRGQVEERARTLSSVAEAEEELGRAREELARVRELQRTLELTLTFLKEAQDRAHRTIAPLLAQTITRFLPEVTAQRYLEAAVDPERLIVTVRDRDGHWREATRLSHGTREQIYLLLRMALAQYLAQPGETCPLILDEVTVQSDSARTEALLQCLHAVSRERQVIAFSQEDDVLAWARRNLNDPRDRLERLDDLA